MDYGERKRTTLYLPTKLLNEAKFKSNKSASKTVENLLIQYISMNGSIDELKQLKRESEEIIKNEKNRIKQYEEEIKEIEKQKKLNGENAIKVNDCLESIDRKYKSDKIITVQFLKRLEKSRNMPFDVLNGLVLQRGYPLISE